MPRSKAKRADRVLRSSVVKPNSVSESSLNQLVDAEVAETAGSAAEEVQVIDDTVKYTEPESGKSVGSELVKDNEYEVNLSTTVSLDLSHEKMAESADTFAAVKAPTFNGKGDALTFMKQFDKFLKYRAIENDENKTLNLLTVLLKDSASDWVDSLPDSEKDTIAALRASFEKRYMSPESVKYKCAQELFTRKQCDETADDYITDMRKLASQIKATDDILRYAIMNGLRSDISVFVAQKQPESIDDVIQAARLAEVTLPRNHQQDNEPILKQLAEMNEEMKRLGSRLDRQSTANVRTRSPTPERRSVSFADETAQFHQQRDGRFGGRSFQPPRYGQIKQVFQQQQNQKQPMTYNTENQLCTRCGRFHIDISQCIAWGKTCYRCNKRGHLASCCMSAARPNMQQY